MNPSLPRLRIVARHLVDHASAMLPPDRRDWAEAMAHELDYVEGDLQAVFWAAGCVMASYVERSGIATLVHSWLLRAPLACALVLLSLNLLFATALTLAYRGELLHAARMMGGFTPGDDYRRFIPLMETTPWWLHGLWVSASVLCLTAAWQLVRDRRAAFPIFAIAWILSTIGDACSRAMPAYRQVFAFAEPRFARDVLIPGMMALVPLLIGAALWMHARWSLPPEMR